MTNPVPTHAPKTDTPYLDARERAEAEDRKMAEKELPEGFGKFPSMDGANFDELSDKLEIVHLRKLVQHEVENRLEERRKKKHVSKLCGEALKKVCELESTLARAIQQRDQFLDERGAAIQDYMAERASRLRAEALLTRTVGFLPGKLDRDIADYLGELYEDLGVTHWMPLPNALKEKNMDDLRDKQAQSRANLTDAGRRWEDIHAEYAAMATEKFYEEYPEARPEQEKR